MYHGGNMAWQPITWQPDARLSFALSPPTPLVRPEPFDSFPFVLSPSTPFRSC